MKVIYTAVFLLPEEQGRLLAAFPAKHPQVHGGHVTLVFKPSPAQLEAITPHLGKEVEVEVTGMAIDDRGQAVTVEIPSELKVTPESPKDTRIHHVTLSCAEGVSPVYSNELLKGAIVPPSVPLRLKGVVRHFER